MKSLCTIVLAVAAAGCLTACTATTAQPTNGVPTGINRPASPVAEPAAAPSSTPASSVSTPSMAAATPTPTAVGSGVQDFGKAYAYEDGLSLTVSAPQPYKPSEYAAGKDGFSKFVVFDVIVVNKTPKPWDPVLFHASVQSANVEGSAIFDSGKLPAPPQTKVLPGRETRFKVAFGITDPADVVMEVRPDFDHSSVLFQKK